MNDYHLLQCMLENYKNLFIQHCHNDNQDFKYYIIKQDIEPMIEWVKELVQLEEDERDRAWEESRLNDADNDDL
jgi:hypothetical protein